MNVRKTCLCKSIGERLRGWEERIEAEISEVSALVVRWKRP